MKKNPQTKNRHTRKTSNRARKSRKDTEKIPVATINTDMPETKGSKSNRAKTSKKRKAKKKTLGLGKRRRLSESSSEGENVAMQMSKGGNFQFVFSGINEADVTATNLNDEMVSDEFPSIGGGGGQVEEMTLGSFMNNAKVK